MAYSNAVSYSDRASKSSLVFLALGGNIAPRGKYIHSGLRILKRRFPANFAASSLYLAKAYGNANQPYFYNCCLKFETELSAFELLDFLLAAENRIGRERTGRKWQSRVIDLDIVFFGKELINTPELKIPHYDVGNRDFFLTPLIELEPAAINPETNRSLTAELALIPEKLRTYPVFLQKLV